MDMLLKEGGRGMIELKFTYVDRNQNCITWENKECFNDLKEAKQHLKENYPHSRKPIYVDMKDGSTRKCGYVFSHREKYQDTGKTFIEEIWVSFYEKDIKPIYL